VVSKEDFPEILEITSVDKTGQIMSLRHREFDLRAVQFHPESVLTPQGKQMIQNWVLM
jgi:anthranilate synthase component 2